jgi:anti-sigma regulatory factor (Ser/Thr protein kinase)
LAQTRWLSPNPTQARRELLALLRGSGWPGDVEGVCLAVHEAIMNSERHAGGATSAVARTNGQTLVVEVHDAGPGFDIDRYADRPPEPLAEQGRGLWLISQIADGWQVDRSGGKTRLQLTFVP